MLVFFFKGWYNRGMEEYLKNLDEYFCENYCDYVRLASIEGYSAPDMIVIGADGNVSRKDEKLLRLCHQKNCDEVLANLKSSLEDTYFTFYFAFVSPFRRLKNRFDKHSFHKLLPILLAHSKETVQSAAEKLDILPKVWKALVKGKVRPEKNTVLALALVCRLNPEDTNVLLNVCGFNLQSDSVRDVVVGYLLQQKIFNPTMRDRCLAEYKIESLPILKVENA